MRENHCDGVGDIVVRTIKIWKTNCKVDSKTASPTDDTFACCAINVSFGLIRENTLIVKNITGAKKIHRGKVMKTNILFLNTFPINLKVLLVRVKFLLDLDFPIASTIW